MSNPTKAFLRTAFLISMLFTGLTATTAWAAFDINTASAEEIQQQVEGIGPKKAQAIVNYRKKHGKFKFLDEVKNVPGIGDKTVAKIQQSSGKKLKTAAKKADKVQAKSNKVKTNAEKKLTSKTDSSKSKLKDSKITYKDKTATQQKKLAKDKKSSKEKLAKKSQSQKDVLAKAKSKSKSKSDQKK